MLRLLWGRSVGEFCVYCGVGVLGLLWGRGVDVGSIGVTVWRWSNAVITVCFMFFIYNNHTYILLQKKQS